MLTLTSRFFSHYSTSCAKALIPANALTPSHFYRLNWPRWSCTILRCEIECMYRLFLNLGSPFANIDSICLAVSKPWKSLLEASPKLWTTFDTRATRRPVSLHSLKMHLRRSKYTLNKAIINWRAKFDGAKMEYLMRTCKQLRHLEMDGSGGVIGDSLTNAIPLAQNLRTLTVSGTCHITPKAMLLALTTCQKTLVSGVFLVAEGKIDRDDPWPRLESMESFELRVAQKYGRNFDPVRYNPPTLISGR